MKIAMLVKNFSTTGGANRYAVELSAGLARRGHDVHVYAQQWEPALVGGLTLHPVPGLLRPRYVNSLLYALRVRRLLRSERFDVVHSHQRTIDHHVLSMHHSCYDAGSRVSPARWLNPRHLVYRWLEARQFGCASLTHVIAVSDLARREILARYPLGPSTVRAIYPGVDLTRMSAEGRTDRQAIRKQFGIGERELVLLLVGTEFKRKGLRFAIEALAQLRQGAAGGCHLVVVGGGGQREFRALAARHGVESRVHFAGLSAAVEPYYAAADLFVLPTLDEPFGMAVLEAMGFGLPVIVSRQAGVAELLKPGETALLLDDPRNAGEIAAAVARLADADERAALGRRGGEAVRAFTWERMVGEVEALYRDALELRRARKDHP